MPKKNKKKFSSRKDSNSYKSVPEHIKLIVEAILSNDLESVSAILKYDHDYNESFIDGAPPLTHAVKSGNIDIVKEFINLENLEIDKLDSYKKTPLENAIQKEEPEIAKLLLENGANPFLCDITDEEFIDNDLLNKIKLGRRRIQERKEKKEVTCKAISACAVMHTIMSPVFFKSNSSIQRLPFEIRIYIIGFLMNDISKDIALNFLQVIDFNSKILVDSRREKYPLIFQYNSQKNSYDLREMPIFGLMMHPKVNIIDIRFAKISIRLAWKLLAGITDIVEEDDLEEDFKFHENPWDFIDKSLSVTRV